MEVVSRGQMMIFSGNKKACPLSYLLFPYSSSNLAKEYSTSCSKGDDFLPLWHLAVLVPNDSKCEAPNHGTVRQKSATLWMQPKHSRYIWNSKNHWHLHRVKSLPRSISSQSGRIWQRHANHQYFRKQLEARRDSERITEASARG